MFDSQGSQALLALGIIIAVLVAGYYFKKLTGVDPDRDAQGRRYDGINHRTRNDPVARLLDIAMRLLSQNRRR